jgi:serine/threonine-protein kinase RsbW
MFVAGSRRIAYGDQLAAMDTDIVLWAPARTSSIHLLRTVAASAGAGFDLSVDDIDDLRLAVTEAASQLLLTSPPGSRLCLRLSPQDHGMRLTVIVEGAPTRGAHGPGGGVQGTLESSLAWQVLLALGEDLRFVHDDSGIGVTFTKSRKPAGQHR